MITAVVRRIAVFNHRRERVVVTELHNRPPQTSRLAQPCRNA